MINLVFKTKPKISLNIFFQKKKKKPNLTKTELRSKAIQIKFEDMIHQNINS